MNYPKTALKFMSSAVSAWKLRSIDFMFVLTTLSALPTESGVAFVVLLLAAHEHGMC